MLGGTFVNSSPTVFPFNYVLIPTLERMGAKIGLEVIKPGYFPDVIGEVKASITALKNGETLKSIELLDRGFKSSL